jgi:hypothetical protein
MAFEGEMENPFGGAVGRGRNPKVRERGGSMAGTRAAPGGCALNSFTGDTEVLMADGSRKAIRDVKDGDKVLATDPETGRTEAKAVVALIVGEGSKNLVDITVDTDGAAGDATGTIVATDLHPFWVDDRGEWVNANQLTPGAMMLTPQGTRVSVVKTHRYSAVQRVHNLTVEGIHTYYVLTGATAVLVHNSACRTFGFANAPKVPGVYQITLKDGRVYVGSSATDVHERLHAAFRDDSAAVKSAGYTVDDIASIGVNDMTGSNWQRIRQQEQSVMDQYGGIGGGVLLNRRNEVP